MTDFLKDCYFNGFCKGKKNFVPNPRFAKKIRAMPLNVKFKPKIFLSTPRYAA
jgi:hypothetical protein